MSETKNYQLTLNDDDQMKFYEWRKSINGSSNSNMEKIDTALGEKANLSIAIDTTLLASAWSANAPYSQTVPVEGLAADSNGVISIGRNISSEQVDVVCDAGMRVTDQGEGTLTVTAYGDKPNCDIPVLIILLG